jgi:hypothetical protein
MLLLIATWILNIEANSFCRERKRKRLGEDNCNNVLKRTKLNAERQHEYRETHKNVSAEYTGNYRKRKAQGKAQENKTP